MAGKTDRAALVSQIQQLCLDFCGYRHLARHSLEPQRWSKLLNDYRQGNASRIAHNFDEVNAALQNGVPNAEFYRILSDAIEKATS